MDLKIPIYNDVWMDNALENFFSLIVENDSEKKITIKINKDNLYISSDDNDFKDILKKIVKNHKIYSCVKEKKDNEIVEFKKEFIIIQEDKKINNLVNLKPKLFKNPNDEIDILFDNISDGSKTCVLCGSSFKKKYSNLIQAVYPLSTKIKSLNGVRTYKNGELFSFKEYNDSICPLCYLIGILGWFSKKIIYRSILKNNNFLIFLPNLNNLEDLNKFKDNYFFLLNNNNRGSNIRVSQHINDVENTYGKFSTLLCFYGKFLIMYEDIPSIKWNILSIPRGNMKNVKLYEFSFDENILNIIKIFINDYNNDIYTLFDSISVKKDKNLDNGLSDELKENLASSFLNNNFRHFAKNFVIKNGKNLIFSNKKIEFSKTFDLFINLWRLKFMGINENDLKTIKSVANIIAKVSKQNISLFYKLDKTKNINEFWNCLREISKKLINPNLDKKHIKESSLDDLIVLLKHDENNWREIRDLLIIYSSMFYSISNRRGDNYED